MALTGSCDARDGERIRSRGLSRTGVVRVCGDLRFVMSGSVDGGAVSLGVEWLAAWPGRNLPAPTTASTWEMQSEAVGRPGTRPAMEKKRRRRSLVVATCSPRPIRPHGPLYLRRLHYPSRRLSGSRPNLGRAIAESLSRGLLALHPMRPKTFHCCRPVERIRYPSLLGTSALHWKGFVPRRYRGGRRSKEEMLRQSDCGLDITFGFPLLVSSCRISGRSASLHTQECSTPCSPRGGS